MKKINKKKLGKSFEFFFFKKLKQIKKKIGEQ